MKTTTANIARGAAKTALTLLFFSGLFSRCASTMTPQGGPRDTLPPVAVSYTPAEGTLDFDAKRIFIEFDEYVQLKDQQKELYTSPIMKKQPVVAVRGKGIQIDLRDTLRENTTYAINFGSSIADNNEGNPLHGFRYVFSTGGAIDSMYMSGYTVDAYTGDSVAKTFLFFFDTDEYADREYDSTLFRSAPAVVARAENSGIFVAENLKPVPYRVYALQDNNNNMQYEPGVDKVAFLEGWYNPAEMPDFSVWYDTLRMCRMADPQLHLRMFTDKTFRRQYLAEKARPLQHKIELRFGAEYPEIDSVVFENLPAGHLVTEYQSRGRDSLALWIDLPAEAIPDTLRGSIAYHKHDSLNRMIPVVEPLVLGWKAFETREQQRRREKAEKERERAEAEGREYEPEPEPNPFRVSFNPPRELNPLGSLEFVFDYPLTATDSTRIRLIRKAEDEKRYGVRVRLEQDSVELRKWRLLAPWQQAASYELIVEPGAFVNLAGQTNDTIKARFSTFDEEKFSKLVVRVEGKTPDSKYILQLLGTGSGANAKVLEEKRGVTTGTHEFRFVQPGEARIRVIEDLNGNGVWDTGDLVSRRQPERAEIYVNRQSEEVIPTKANWEIEVEMDMNELFAPITMERVVRRLRRAEQIRVAKYLADRARERAEAQKAGHDHDHDPNGSGGSTRSGRGSGFGSGSGSRQSINSLNRR